MISQSLSQIFYRSQLYIHMRFFGAWFLTKLQRFANHFVLLIFFSQPPFPEYLKQHQNQQLSVKK